MIKSLKNLFKTVSHSEEIQNNENLKILCGLMIEAANTDGVVSQTELDKISFVLINIFKEDKFEVESILNQTIIDKDEPKSLYFYTSKINKIFSDSDKLILIETLWEIILSDGELHEFESNLIRRLAGLLYISDVSCGNAKRKAIENINNK